jgi:chaperonin cofactor prefoldin
MQKNRLLFLTVALAAFFGMFASAQTQPAPQFRDIPAGHWAREAVTFVVQQGLVEGFPNGTFRGNQNLTRYQAALIFFRLLKSGKMNQVAPGDAPAVGRGMEEVSKEIEDLKARFAALEKTTQDQGARIVTLENEVRGIPALQERVTTLETQFRNLGSGTAGSPNVSALEARVATLEEQLRARDEQLRALTAQVGGQTPATPAPTTQTGTPQTDLRPVASSGGGSRRNFYLGVGAGLDIISTPAIAEITDTLSVAGMIGLREFLLGFGLRVGVNYNLKTGGLGGEAFLTRGLGPLYLGVGARAASFEGDIAANTFGTGLIGLDLNLFGPISLFAEATPGVGANTTFSLGAKAGLKLNF